MNALLKIVALTITLIGAPNIVMAITPAEVISANNDYIQKYMSTGSSNELVLDLLKEQINWFAAAKAKAESFRRRHHVPKVYRIHALAVDEATPFTSLEIACIESELATQYANLASSWGLLNY